MSGMEDEAPLPCPSATRELAAEAFTTDNPWLALRRFTDARIAQGRAGVSLPTRPQLDFQLAHAQARDAVHVALDMPAMVGALQPLAALTGHEVLSLHSAAADRQTYLKRPDLGRKLDAASRQRLVDWRRTRDADGRMPALHEDVHARPFDLAFVVADGLSPLAIGLHAAAFLGHVMPGLKSEGWQIAPLTLVAQSRVALADEVGELLGARLSVMLIGERPGLSSPDSMGLYLTWMPQTGRTDAQRNCISNIREAGLSYPEAARKLLWLLNEARQRGLSGVALKEEG